jgi:uncharacterized protein YjdB
MHHNKKIIIFLVLSIYLLPFLSPSSLSKASQVDFNHPLRWVFQDSISAEIGDEFYLFSVSALFDCAKFKSSKSSIASIDEFGLVTAKKAGTATITVTINKVSIRYQVTVYATTINLNFTKLSLENSQIKQLVATSSTDSTVAYKSSKNSVATIDANGYITAVKPGQTTITASCDGTKVTCKVTIKAPTINLNHVNVTLYRSQTVNLIATVSSNLTPTWKTNRKSIACVDENGFVTAQKHGTATITATVDHVSKTCTITVIQPTITLNNYQVSLLLGQTYSIKPKVSSGNHPTFKTSNDRVVTVNSDGFITAINKGTAYITVSEDGVKVKCKVDVSSE